MEVDGQKAEDCLNKTGFSERMPDMPRGLDTPLYRDFESDGVEISGGEAQKIALARALYKDAPSLSWMNPLRLLIPWQNMKYIPVSKHWWGAKAPFTFPIACPPAGSVTILRYSSRGSWFSGEIMKPFLPKGKACIRSCGMPRLSTMRIIRRSRKNIV